MTITTSGSNPTKVEAVSNTTTVSNSDALQDINDSIVGIIDSGVTVDGFGLAFVSTFGILPPPGATIQITNDGTVSTDQNSSAALSANAGQSGNFGDFTYSGSGNVTNTGSGGSALSITDPTGNVDITVSGTSTISGSTTGAGIEASSGNSTATVKVTVQSGGTVEGQIAVSFGNGVDTLDNSGTVQGTGSLSSGVGGVLATVTNSGTISGTTSGVNVDNVTLTNNSGAMIETTGTTAAEAAVAAIVAVEALTAADITNQSGATIQATGPLGQVGILVGQTGATGDATVHNAGTISGPLDAINTQTSGTTSITNSGSITATTRSGIRVNTATIENDQGGTISGLNGIFFRDGFGASTVFNDGTVTGTGATPTAIHFSTGSSGNTLTLGTDSVINGNVLGAGSDILQLGGTGSASFDVSNIGAAAQYQGFATFNKIDTSTWTLTGVGANGWTVEQGTLQVDGTIGAATVQSGGTLDGTGTTGALTVQSGGTLAPGDAPGTMTTGDLDLESGSALSIEAEGTSPGVGGFDQVDVNGSVTLGGTLSFTLLNGFTPANGATFEIINNDGNDAVNGTFAGLSEGATFTQAGVTYSISYAGGTGNDVVLTVQNAPAASVHIVKSVNGQDADTATGPHVAAGSTLTFTYVVTDTGSGPLANVAVTDDKLGPITSFTGDTNNNGLLDTNETWTYTATATAQPGQQTNVGTVTANDASNPATTVTDSNPANYFGDTPAIHIVKFVNGQDADTAPGPHVAAGSTLTFTYVVTDTGNVPLANVAVTDNKLGSITSFTGDTNNNGLLDPTETWTYTATATAQAGQQTNIGTVTANDADNPTTTVTDANPANYFGDAAAAASIHIVKFVNGQDADSPTGPHAPTGSNLTFTYVVTNTGSDPLANVAVTDDKLGPITSFTGDTNHNGLLDTNETWTYTATATAQAGQHTNVGTVTANDANNPSTTVTSANPANYFGDPANLPPPRGTTADMIADRPSTGDYEIYDLGNNTVLAAHPLTNIASPWQVVGLGGFNGSDTTDMMLRNMATGSFEIVDVSNNNAGAPIQIGNVGLEWAVAGFGDFSGHAGETDMLLRNSNNGNFELYDISNNTVTSATPLGNVGLGVRVLGFGDFSGKANETDMLMRDSNTGVLELYELSNNTVTSVTPQGNIGSEWQFAGAGDFSGRPGETDLLMRNSNNGDFELYDFQSGKITSATPLGNVGLDWGVAGFGDLSGNPNETDMLMRNLNTGQFTIYDITNNQVSGFHSMGQSGLEWRVDGVAIDPPTASTSDSHEVQSPLAPVAASDPVQAGSWLTGTTPQSDASWLTQAMQASGAANQSSLAGTGFGSSNAGPGPGFDAGSTLIAGTLPLSSLAMPNPLQTHTA